MDRWRCVECGVFHGQTCCVCSGPVQANMAAVEFVWSEPFIGSQAYNDHTILQRTLTEYVVPIFCKSCNTTTIARYRKRDETSMPV